jgi:hypothetical protein
MRHFRIAIIITVLVASCGSSAIARTRIRALKALVRFLATSTLVRGSWGLNQDIYLAELTTSAAADPQLIRLIDEYNHAASPLSKAALTSPSGTTLLVWRDSQCDLAYRAIVLRTAPGDPLAILPERLGYQPHMDHPPTPDTILPCYRTVR